MAINLNDNIKTLAPKPVDNRYLNNLVPYSSVNAANSAIPESQRYTGLTVNINKDEYWYYSGVTNSDLILKIGGSGAGLIASSNGLSDNGNVVKLGGGLTENTFISGDSGNYNLSIVGLNSFNLGFDNVSTITDTGTNGGIRYGGDYSANYNLRSIPDVNYVTGITGGLDGRLDIIEPIYVTGATNGLSKDGNHLVKLGGTISEPIDITIQSGSTFFLRGCNNLGGFLLIGNCQAPQLNQARIQFITSNYHGSSIQFGDNNEALINSQSGLISKSAFFSYNNGWSYQLDYSSDFTNRSLVDKEYVDNAVISGTSLITVSNGLTKNGDVIVLGGTLTENTTIDGNNLFDLSLTDLKQFNLSFTGISTITDGGTNGGIRYAGDYSTNFVNRSLVDKAYVDAVATGLYPKSAVLVATTTGITLSGTQIIDGVSLISGDRVLVKDQIDAEDNGIYIVAAGAWSRSTDFDGNPTGEVERGDLIPVLNGDANASTSWILVTPNPIIVGTTELTFTKFSQLLFVSEGDGIRIDTTGTNREININLASNSGLEFVNGNTELSIGNISGSGTTWNNGQLNTNVSAVAIAGTAIPVKLDGNNLAIDGNDVNLSALITGATNGLGVSGKNVVLGGTLANNTTITADNYNIILTNTIDDSEISLYNGSYLLNRVGSNYYALTDTSFEISLRDSDNYMTTSFGSQYSYLIQDNGKFEIGTFNGNDVDNSIYLGVNQISVNSGNILVGIGGAITGFSGIQYVDDYSLNYVNRSLVDKEYVDNQVNSLTGITSQSITGATNIGGGAGLFDVVTNREIELRTLVGSGDTVVSTVGDEIIINTIIPEAEVTGATNGLSINGNKQVVLGGTLTGNTTIDIDVNDLNITGGYDGGTSFGIKLDTTNDGVHLVTLAGSYFDVDYDTIIGYASQGAGITLTDVVNLDGLIELETSPSVGLESDAVLVWNSSDNQIKQVPQSSLGEKNNIYSYSAVTSNVTLTTGSTYVILVNPSAEFTVTLPATPINGQVFKIKDISGHALTYNVIIDGNGNNIDGSSTATINTDYGALELLYNGTAWFSLAFIN